MSCSLKITLSISLLAAIACSSNTPSEEVLCDGAKCDTPGGAANAICAEECSDSANLQSGETNAECRTRCRREAAFGHCEDRRADAIDSAQKTFTKDAIRWACADVQGVNTNGRDDRGQEYCEYFPVIQLPPAIEGGTELPETLTPGRLRANRPALPLEVPLTEDQVFALEDNPDARVGECVFTSWHQDINVRLPICGDSDVTCPELKHGAGATLPPWTTSPTLGVKMTADMLKMKVSINSNGAAADLFEKCLVEPAGGDPANTDDPLHDDFVRGCMKSFDLFQTEWRRSDPSVCAAGVRMAECGCGVDTDGDGAIDLTGAQAISRAVVPHQPDADGNIQLWGFPLGTWSGQTELPTGCSFVETGDPNNKNLVTCEIKASDLLANKNDPKEFCRAKYGDNVVVHVPVPAGALVCNPPADGQYNNSCSTMPWIVGEVGEPIPGDGDGGDDDSGDDDGENAACDFPTGTVQSGPATNDANCPCVTEICDADSFCCDSEWDTSCTSSATANAAAGGSCEGTL